MAAYPTIRPGAALAPARAIPRFPASAIARKRPPATGAPSRASVPFRHPAPGNVKAIRCGIIHGLPCPYRPPAPCHATGSRPPARSPARITMRKPGLSAICPPCPPRVRVLSASCPPRLGRTMRESIARQSHRDHARHCQHDAPAMPRQASRDTPPAPCLAGRLQGTVDPSQPWGAHRPAIYRRNYFLYARTSENYFL